MLTSLARTLYDGLSRRPRSAVGGLLVALALGGWACLGLELDMSFRPLFAAGGEDLERTAEFEAQFGAISGSAIGVVLEGEQVTGADFLDRLADLSQAVAGLEHVERVDSLVTLRVPDWSTAPPVSRPLLPGVGEERAQRLAQLRSDAPALLRGSLSAEGDCTVLWAHLDLPLARLDQRAPVIEAFRERVEAQRPPGTRAHLVGVSVVEDAYASLVLRSLAISISLTVLLLAVTSLATFGSLRSIAVVLGGVSLAVPLTLGWMALTDRPVTIVSSMVPTMILVIGVADATHLLRAFLDRCAAGVARFDAGREAYGELALPNLMTTATSAAGFLSLQLADLPAIREFGLAAALGVVLVWLTTLVAFPVLVALWPPEPRNTVLDRGLQHLVVRGSRMVIGRPAAVAAVCVIALAAVSAFAPRLRIQQSFNAEVAQEHPLRAAQALLEERLDGILGPEISLRRRDRRPLDETDGRRLRELQQALAEDPAVTSVFSLLDLAPPEVGWSQRLAGLGTLRTEPQLGPLVRSTVDEAGTWVGLVVRTPDLGSDRAAELVERIEAATGEHLGEEYEALVVGPWWLAQQGMASLLHDMLASFAGACVLVLPLLALAVRDLRLFLVGLLPNVLPMSFALGFMALVGISLRVGTAMVLAIALGIAIDDTIHVLVRLRRETRAGRGPREAVGATFTHTGRAVVATTLILVLGFATFVPSSLLALRDMGLVGMLTLSVALVADLALAPALFLLWPAAGQSKKRSSSRPPAR